MTKLSFQKLSKLTKSGLIEGRIYFESSTGIIHVATGATTTQEFGVGVKSADWNAEDEKLVIKNQDGKDIEIDFSDLASASSMAEALGKKLNVGTAEDGSSVQSYYGLKKYTDEKIAAIPAAIEYKADGTTITESKGSGEVTFSVGEIAQSKVTGLTTALDAKATTAALEEVKKTADAAAPQSTTYTKSEVDSAIENAVGSVYRVKGTVANVSALTGLENVAIGDVYNVTNGGILNSEEFEPGSNFVATKAGAGNQADMWDKLGGTIDLSSYLQESDVTDLIDDAIEALDGTVTGNSGFVKTISQTDGKITAERVDITMSDVTGLSTELNKYALKATTVNGHDLSDDVTIEGDEINLSSAYTAASAYTAPKAGDSVESAIASLAKGVAEATSAGVTSFQEATGAITVDTVGSGEGSVKFTMTGNKLSASVPSLKSAAFAEASEFDTAGTASSAVSAAKNELIGSNANTASDDTIWGAKKYAASLASNYATSDQGAKADSALQSVSASGANKYVTAEAAAKANNAQAITVTAVTGKVEDNADALATASDVKTYVDSAVAAVDTSMYWADFA